MLKLHELTRAKAEYIKNECCFTEIEEKCFDLRRKGKSNVQIAQEVNMSVSGVDKVFSRIKRKYEMAVLGQF